jgi:hypothetical protein
VSPRRVAEFESTTTSLARAVASTQCIENLKRLGLRCVVARQRAVDVVDGEVDATSVGAFT